MSEKSGMPPIEWFASQEEQRRRTVETFESNVASLQQAIHEGEATAGDTLDDALILIYGTEYFADEELRKQFKNIEALTKAHAGEQALLYQRTTSRKRVNNQTVLQDTVSLDYGVLGGGLEIIENSGYVIRAASRPKGTLRVKGYKNIDEQLSPFLVAKADGLILAGTGQWYEELQYEQLDIGLEDINYKTQLVARRLLIGEDQIAQWLTHKDNSDYFLPLRSYAGEIGVEPINPPLKSVAAANLDAYTELTNRKLRAAIEGHDSRPDKIQRDNMRFEISRMEKYELPLDGELVNRAQQILRRFDS